jgi:hypothetical protein
MMIRMFRYLLLAAVVALGLNPVVWGQAPPFDGRPWNLSTGNLSVGFIQASPIGSFPKPNFFEAPPAADWLARQKSLGLVAD